MKFTNKFTFITSTIVLSCIALVLVGGLVSLRSLTLKYHQQRIDSIIKVIDKQIEKQTTTTEFDHWLPDLLDASGIVRLQVKRDDVTVYQNYFQSREYYPMRLLLRYAYDLENYPGVKLIIYTRQPFSDLQFTFWPLAGISIAIFLCLGLLYFSLRWIKRSFHGAELLERRAHYLLENNPTARFAQAGEWPKTASKALDILSERLENSRKERSIFDAHIRSKAFLDQDTGLGNRIAFENRLDAVAMNENFSSNALIVISLTELSSLKYQFGIEESERVIQQVVMLLKNFCIYCDDAFYGRVEKSKFVILLPQMNYEETKNSAKKITKSLFQLQLPNATMIDCFFHVGVVNFPFGAKTEYILEDLNRALLVAEYQKNSGWHLSEEGSEHTTINKGSVKWRALFTNILDTKQLLFYQQPIIQRDGINTAYTELWPRILGYNNEIIAAGTFMPMAEKCGLNEHMDKLMLEKVLALLITGKTVANPIAVNLGVQLLLNKKNYQWLMFELMEQPRQIRNNLVIEVSEHLINKNYDSLRSVLNGLQKIGCKIAIDNVGKTVVNTQYILDFNIDYLKLHPSLVRDLHLRKMNQIAIQSLMASCLDSHAQVIAVGVEQKEEWMSLLQLGIFGAQGAFFMTPQPM